MSPVHPGHRNRCDCGCTAAEASAVRAERPYRLRSRPRTGETRRRRRVLTDSGTATFETDDGEWVTTTGTSIMGSLFLVTLLMILFRQRYPTWWFDFARELTRFSARVTAYFALVTDRYPSTVEEQSVHLDVDYPDVERDLNRWLPLVKWFLAIPHFIILFFLGIGAFFAVVIAWFAILFTGRYPKGLFDFVVGVGRWSLRVYAYAFLLVTDRYPPFSLD